ENPPSLAEQMDDSTVRDFGSNASLDRYGIANLRVAKTITYEVQANWKLIMENTLECYHCGPMHPELCALLPEYKTGAIDGNDGTTFADGVEAFTITGKASRPPLPGLLPEDTRRYAGFFGLPSIFINLLGDHVAIDWLEPLGPTQTRVTTEWLFDPGAMESPAFDPMDAVAILDLVNHQDWVVCELAQQGMTSRAYVHGGNYAPLEHHIRDFVDYILARLGDEGAE
ncbi:MAG TPA: RHO alpha subunit C-terminal catalytic domain-containing protein, partial [Ktedonobacterales bacterium]